MIRQLLSFSNQDTRRLLRLLIALISASAVLQGLAFLAMVPLLTGLLEDDTGAATRWLVVLAEIGFAYGIVFWQSSVIGNRASGGLLGSLLDRLGDRLVELPTGWFLTERSGEVADTATNGTVFTATAPYAILRPILTAFITPATVLVGALFLDWRLALTMACSVPFIWGAYRWLTGRIDVANKVHNAAVAAASARLVEFARVQPAVRTAGENSIARQLVDDALVDQHAANRAVHLTGGAGIGLFGGVVQLAVTAVIIVGTWLALGGDVEVATLVPLLVLGVRFSEPITHSGALGGGIRLARLTLDQIQTLLDEHTLPEPVQTTTPSDHGIRFDGVSFGYGGDPVLRDLSFEAPAGAMTAIVGPSGSGKTTITRLIARFYDPDEGSVSIGGVPLPELGTDQITRSVAPVFQDVYLFDGSILDNIWIGDPEATQEDVIHAGADARVDQIAARLSDGWEARVGEGGTNLSGGERQRISIARALLKNSPIVLLDEATAALDVDNEQAIHAAFDALREGRTLVVIAHRLHTIAGADRILMLDGHGGIAEQGTHQELLAAGGRYARYWSDRQEASQWRLATTPTIEENRP